MAEAFTGGRLLHPTTGRFALWDKGPHPDGFVDYSAPAQSSSGKAMIGVQRESAIIPGMWFIYNMPPPTGHTGWRADSYGWLSRRKLINGTVSEAETWMRQGPFHYKMPTSETVFGFYMFDLINGWPDVGGISVGWRLFRSFTVTVEMKLILTENQSRYMTVIITKGTIGEIYNDALAADEIGQYTKSSDPIELEPDRYRLYCSAKLGDNPDASAEVNFAGLPLGDCEDSTLVSGSMF